VPNPLKNDTPLPTRQMSDEEITAEVARSRAVAIVSMGTVVALLVGIFSVFLALKVPANTTNDIVAQLEAIDSHKGLFIFAYFAFAIGMLLLIPILLHIALAVRARMPAVPKYLLYVALAGPVLVALTLPPYMFAQVAVANDFAAGTVKTVAHAKDLSTGTGIQITQLAYQFADLVLAISWVGVAIYGMRAGLLTKLFGYTAVAIAITNVFGPRLAALISVFWVGGVAIMLLGRSAMQPPAWVLGRPVPWSEVAENAEAIRAETEEASAHFEKPAAKP
jgi:hypothetical protein